MKPQEGGAQQKHLLDINIIKGLEWFEIRKFSSGDAVIRSGIPAIYE